MIQCDACNPCVGHTIGVIDEAQGVHMDLIVRGILLCVALLAAGVANAAIYQCPDASGRKVFQDTPCSAGQKPLEIPGSSNSRPTAPETKTSATKPSETSAPAGAGEIVEGRWEITTQKFSGSPLQPEGAAETSKQCIGPGWLKQQARLTKDVSALGGSSCKEVRSELTQTRWQASVSCNSKEGTSTIEQEFVFSSKSMRGEADASGVAAGGKEWREVHRVTGRWLGPC